MKMFYFFIRVDLYFIGVFGYLWVEVRFVNDIGDNFNFINLGNVNM